MSADNGIYIGRFPKTETTPEDYEYRVIHATAIENLHWTPTDTLEENSREIVAYYKSASVITQDEAQKKAFELEKEILADDFCPVLEYGINTLTFQHPFQYYLEHAHEVVYPWDVKEEV